MKRLHFLIILAASAFVLSLASFFIVMQGVSDEPYIVFRKSDAIVQIGVAMILMLLWLQLLVGTVWGVARHRISAWWLLLLPWMLFGELVLFYCSKSYMQDIARFAAQSH
jgi:hypothetical protein